MVHLDFAGAPDLAAIRSAAQIAHGAFVRVRWDVAEEERETVDHAAIVAALAGAVEVKLEARVIPVLRSRVPGISQAHSLDEKLRRWAEATGVEADGIAARLARLESSDADEIAREIAREDQESAQEGSMAASNFDRRAETATDGRGVAHAAAWQEIDA
jgi:exonuclease SbcD